MANWTTSTNKLNPRNNCYEKSRASKMARNQYSSNAIVIEYSYNYNGSGITAFGGAKKWPHLTVKIDFSENDLKERNRIGKLIQKLLDKEMPLPV